MKKAFLVFILSLALSACSSVVVEEEVFEDDVEMVDRVDEMMMSEEEVDDVKDRLVSLPHDDALERVSVKPFGIYVSPGNSPVENERFSGYHVGVDFEILAGEENVDVPVRAICNGKVLVRSFVNGYGGVLLQTCVIEEKPVRVLYGHLSLSSIVKNVGDTLSQDEEFAVLGEGDSLETDYERKHLHLGIRKGEIVDYRGYVQSKEEISDWIDFLELYKN